MFNLQGLNALTMCFNSGAVAAGTTAGTVQIAAAIAYAINAIFYSKAITNNIALPAPSPVNQYTAGAIQSIPVGQKALFAGFLDAAGNVTFAQSALVDGDEEAPVIATPEDKACFVVFTVKATSAVFVPGTTALGTGNTATFYNVAAMPGSNQV